MNAHSEHLSATLSMPSLAQLMLKAVTEASASAGGVSEGSNPGGGFRSRAAGTTLGSVAISSSNPSIDIGILTIREDEFEAVLAAFSSEAGNHEGRHRIYTLRYADAGNGDRYTVAILRQSEQGNGEAQDAARDLIDELHPKLVLVVGIAGGLPSDDIKLGDVVISTRIQDFTVEARKAKAQPTYAATGGPINKALAARVTNLAARKRELGDWTVSLPAQPAVNWTRKGQLYGPAQWQRDLKQRLIRHYPKDSPPRAPIYATGTIASSDKLVKDIELVIPWLATSRNILAVEMESGGVYRASRERCAMLAIRGISDIVGLRRSEDWTKYACASAAAFAFAFLRTRPIPLRASCSGDEPIEPSAAGADSKQGQLDSSSSMWHSLVDLIQQRWLSSPRRQLVWSIIALRNAMIDCQTCYGKFRELKSRQDDSRIPYFGKDLWISSLADLAERVESVGTVLLIFGPQVRERISKYLLMENYHVAAVWMLEDEASELGGTTDFNTKDGILMPSFAAASERLDIFIRDTFTPEEVFDSASQQTELRWARCFDNFGGGPLPG